MEKERKQREFQKKSNDYDYEDFEDDFVDTNAGPREGRSFLFNPGAIALIGISAFIFYTFFIKSRKEGGYDIKDD